MSRYRSRPIKRLRRTRAEIDALCDMMLVLLTGENPMTVRQMFYALVSRQLIPKSESGYRTVVRLLGELRLDNAIFAALGSEGTLGADAFASNTAGTAEDSSDRIVYDSDSGSLAYDANGSASGGAVRFATLSPHLALTYQDFMVV